MYKYILESAGNINWMALFALLTFLIVFLTAAVMAFRNNSQHLKYMSELPLNDSIDHDQNNEK